MRSKRVAIKNHSEEVHLISRRCLVVFFITLVLMSLLVMRLAWLQVVHHTLFTTLSEKNWLDLVPVEPTRGLIYDRNGVLLAENIPVFSLDIIPDKVSNIENTLTRLKSFVDLTPNDLTQFQRQLKQHRRFDEVTLKLRLTEEEVARFAESQYRFPGVQVKARLIRHYPFGKAFSHVLGFVGRINSSELRQIDPVNYSATTYIGKSGIEKTHEQALHGQVGYQQAENDASGESIRVLNRIHPIPGKNLWLTLDARLQVEADKAFAGYRGAMVAIDPRNGEILALVSQPGYDPDVFVTGISNAEYDTLQHAPDRPLYNRAVHGTYSPGSTIKPFIALEGLDAAVASPDTTISDPGWYQLEEGGHVFHDWRKLGHGVVNISRAITVSCDIFFYQLAHHLGIERIDEILHAFGFGQLTGVDITGESPGVVASPAWKRRFKQQPWYEGDTIISGIGQGFMQSTPVQLAAATSGIAMRGYRYQPHLVLSEESNGQRISHPPIELERVELEHEEWWDTVINAMHNVIQSREGTGYHFGRPAYTVAAKTGTAQVHSIRHRDPTKEHEDQSALPEKLRDNSLFIGFAPVDSPRLAIAVVVENDNAAASVIARKVMDAWMVEKEDGKQPAG